MKKNNWEKELDEIWEINGLTNMEGLLKDFIKSEKEKSWKEGFNSCLTKEDLKKLNKV